jgi:hypothetical protein
MYEMKGALSGYGPGSAGFPASRLRVSQSPGLAVPDPLVSQLHRSSSTGHPALLFRVVRLPGLPGATRRPSVPDTRGKYRFPGFPAPRGSPGMVPVSCGESISTASRAHHARAAGNSFQIFSCPHVLHRIPPVIRTLRRLSTALCTTTPQATWRNSGNTGAWSPYVIILSFSRRIAVIRDPSPPASRLPAVLIGGSGCRVSANRHLPAARGSPHRRFSFTSDRISLP